MLKQQINFEWSVGDDEFGALFQPQESDVAFTRPHTTDASPLTTALAHSQSWLPAHPVEPGQLLSSAELQFLRQRLRDLLLIGLAAILLGSMPFTPEQVEQRHAEEGVTAALAAEYTAWQQKDRDGFTALLDLPSADRWQWEWRDYWSLAPADFADLGLSVQRVDRQGEFVRVATLVTRPSTKWWRSSPYREIRFYRETPTGWLRTLPPESYWGAQQIRETAHLRFEYRTQDAAVIEPQVDRLEALYQELYQFLALDPDTREKWTFILVPDRTDGRTSDYYRTEYTSPALSEVPAMLSDQEYVAQMMVSSMASQAVYGASPNRRNYLHTWEMVVWSLYGWLRSDLLDQRSPWHAQAQVVFKAALPERLPLRLADIENWPDDNRPAQERIMRQYMVSESIIDFAMHTYGRSTMPALLTGLEQERDWERLTTTVFGVSASAFEAAWNRYLAQTYLDQAE